MEDIPTKNPGDQLTAGEYNSPTAESKNVVTNSGQALNAGDSAQFTKAAANYTGSADYFIDSGVVDAYVINAISPKLAPTAYADGLRVRFIPTNTNTGASTVNLNSLGAQAIKKYGRTVDVEPGDLTQGRVTELTFNQSDDVFELISLDNPIVVESIPLFKSFSGLALSNNTVTPDTKLDIAAGTFKDRDTAAASTLSNPIIKLLDAVWMAGSNVGGRASGVPFANDTWYHVFIIAKPDGTTDVGFDTSIDATNLLADAVGYTLFRRRGSVRTGAALDILPFLMNGDIVSWKEAIVVEVFPGVSPVYVPVTILAPPDVFTEANCGFAADVPTNIGASTNPDSFRVKSTFMTDLGGAPASPYEVSFQRNTTGPSTTPMIGRTRGKVIADELGNVDISRGHPVTGPPDFRYWISVLEYRELEL